MYVCTILRARHLSIAQLTVSFIPFTMQIPYMLQLTTAISHSYDEERCETSMLEIVATYDTLSAIADAVTSALASTT
jgi:hypothetical protein